MASDGYKAACERRGTPPLAPVIDQLDHSVEQGMLLLDIRGNTVPIQQLKRKLTDDDLAAVLEGVAASGIPLAVLQASWNAFTDAGAEALAAALPALPALQHLDVSGNSIGPEGCRALVSALYSCGNLQNLLLDSNALDEAGGEAVAALVAVHPTLTQLSLSHCDLGLKSIIHLASALTTAPRLEYLDLSSPRLSSRNEEAMYHLAKALRSNRTVSTLVLRKWPHLTDTSTASLCDYLLDNGGTLTSLDLGANRIAGPSGVTLAKTLEAGAQLRTLRLSHCRIGDEGACALATVLAGGACALRELDLRHNSIGDAGLVALADAITTTPGGRTGGTTTAASGGDGSGGDGAMAGAAGACALDVLLLAGNDLAPGKVGTTALARVLMADRATTCATDLRPYLVDGVFQVAVES